MKNFNADLLQDEMFYRNKLVYSPDTYEKIINTRAVVVGIGGVGSVVCELLIRLGVRDLVYFARGCYEMGNINRQIPATYITVRARTSKVCALAERLYQINPFAEINPVNCDVVKDNNLVVEQLTNSTPTALFNCVDENYAQSLIAENAYKANIPFFIGGVTGLGREGIVSLFMPQQTTYNEIFPIESFSNSSMDIDIKRKWVEQNRDYMSQSTFDTYTQNIKTPYPVLTPLPWIIASVIVAQYIKLITNTDLIVAPKAISIKPLSSCFPIIDLQTEKDIFDYFPWRP
jgi:molybdopterin/thiamine biosynthesis adenylyltransferase